MNNAKIKAAPVGTILKDTQISGLHLRISARKKSWYLRYVTKEGIVRRPKIAEYPTASISAARDMARELLLQVAMGGDPSRDWQNAKAAASVSDLAERYLSDHAEPNKRPQSVKDDKKLLRLYVNPKIGNLKVQSVAFEDIDKLHKSLRDKPYQGNRLLSLLKKMFQLAEKWRMRPHNSNPCHGVEKFREESRERYMSPEEAQALHQALEAHAESHPRHVAFIYLLMYTGARPSEIARATWDQLDDNVLRLPIGKNNKRRPIVLPKQAMASLDKLPADNGTLTGLQSVRKFWVKLREHAAHCPSLATLRIYDLRHSFASAALSAGHSLPQIGELLGHVNAASTSRYAHLMEDEAVKNAQSVADALDSRMKKTNGDE